jgi:hypothetical protein
MSYTHTMVMHTAWRTARAGAARFGGSVREYLAEALRHAWKAIKASMWTGAFAEVLRDLKAKGIDPAGPAYRGPRRGQVFYRNSFFNPW